MTLHWALRDAGPMPTACPKCAVALSAASLTTTDAVTYDVTYEPCGCEEQVTR